MKHADPLDQASELQEAHNDESIRKARLAAAPEQVRDINGNWPTLECVDCGEDIEEIRLEMGRIRCFSCQSSLERDRKMRGR